MSGTCAEALETESLEHFDKVQAPATVGEVRHVGQGPPQISVAIQVDCEPRFLAEAIENLVT